MAYDSSWIAPTAKNIADIFGLDPAAAAKQRGAQSDAELSAARIRNLDEDTKNKPLEGDRARAQAEASRAAAGHSGAQTKQIDEDMLMNAQLGDAVTKAYLAGNEAERATLNATVQGIAARIAGAKADPRWLQAGPKFPTNPIQAGMEVGDTAAYKTDTPSSPNDILAENKISALIAAEIDKTRSDLTPSARDWLLKTSRQGVGAGKDPAAAVRDSVAALFAQNPVKFKGQGTIWGGPYDPVDSAGNVLPLPGATAQNSGSSMPNGAFAQTRQSVVPSSTRQPMPVEARAPLPTLPPAVTQAPQTTQPAQGQIPSGPLPPAAQRPVGYRHMRADGKVGVWNGRAWEVQ